MNKLYYGDNLEILKEHISDKTIDLTPFCPSIFFFLFIVYKIYSLLETPILIMPLDELSNVEI